MSFFKCLLRWQGVSWGNIGENFDQCQEFLETLTEGHVLTAALQHLKLKKLDDRLKAVPPDERHVLLVETASKVVEMFFMHPHIEDMIRADAGKECTGAYDFCICKEDTGGEMVLCCNAKCPSSQWFHLECKDLTPADIPPEDEPWYCSTQCLHSCATEAPSGDRDHKFEYTKALIFHGLLSLCKRDAIRENDGPRMLLHWRLDMLYFFASNHPKYFIYGHCLLTDTTGGASEAIAFQLTWNRTVNIAGGEGKNIVADLHMEHLNRAYKESVKAAGGQLTAATVERHSQMLGLQQELTDLFNENIAATRNIGSRKRGIVERRKDIEFIIRVLQREKLLQSIPGRYYASFGGFKFQQNVQDWSKMKKRLLKLQQIQYRERRKMLRKREVEARRQCT